MYFVRMSGPGVDDLQKKVLLNWGGDLRRHKS